MTYFPPKRELEAAVKKAAAEEGLAERRLRRWIAVSALVELFTIARNNGDLPPFLVKGGLALEFRFRSRSRSSRDIDIVLGLPKNELVDAAIATMRLPWSGFTFRIKGEPKEREHSYVFEVGALYLDQSWSTFEVELVHGRVDEYDLIEPYSIAEFGLAQPSAVPCLNVTEQIAQKLHAVTDPKEDRPRDLIDIYLLDSRLERNDEMLRSAVASIFQIRAKHSWPAPIDLRDDWESTLHELIERNGLKITVTEVVDGVRALVFRLLGVVQRMNYQYHFLVLSGHTQVPNLMSSAIQMDDAYDIFKRMTQIEGWRPSQTMHHPSGQNSRAVLVVLEKPLDGGPV